MDAIYASVEASVIHVVLWLKLCVDVAGAAVIGVGVIAACAAWLAAVRNPHLDAFGVARLKLARYLALALELQLGADILSTAVSPTWDQIGKLAAIAVIRTTLNYFLRRELEEGVRG